MYFTYLSTHSSYVGTDGKTNKVTFTLKILKMKLLFIPMQCVKSGLHVRDVPTNIPSHPLPRQSCTMWHLPVSFGLYIFH